nr:hypothetical protein [Modestobacter muralis]
MLAASVAVAVLALSTADGVTQLTDIDYSTEFVSAWWWLAFLLAPVPALASRRSTSAAAAVQVVALVVPQFVAAAVCVGRYRSSGWGDGLEVFAYLHPLLLTAVTVGLVAVARRRS